MRIRIFRLTPESPLDLYSSPFHGRDMPVNRVSVQGVVAEIDVVAWGESG